MNVTLVALASRKAQHSFVQPVVLAAGKKKRAIGYAVSGSLAVRVGSEAHFLAYGEFVDFATWDRGELKGRGGFAYQWMVFGHG